MEAPPRVKCALAEPPPRLDHRAALGRGGEDAAARHLEALGYRILERRFRTVVGEIDLIALDHGVLVFVEVKARSTLRCGTPAEAVDRRKRTRLARAAALYLARRNPDRACRFDVVEVRPGAGGLPAVEVIRDAFQV